MKQQPDSGTLILEKAAGSAADFLRHYRLPFFATFLLGLLAYGYAFTNKLVNHDEVSSLFTKGATVTSGRWGLGALDSIFPNFSMPWIYGLITVLLIALSVCVLISKFRIRNRLLQVLLAGSIVVFPSLIGLFGYMFTSSSFALAFFLAVMAAAMVQQFTKWPIFLGLGCLVFSLSIYQSYISVTAGLLVLVLIQQLLRGEEFKAVLVRGIVFVLFLILALGLYYLGTQVVLGLTGNSLNGYASENLAFSLNSVLNGVVLAYSSFFRFFTEGFLGLIPTAFSRILHWLLFGSVLVLFLGHLVFNFKKQPAQIGLLILLLAVLPLAINCMYMITTAESIHTLVMYGFVCFYVLAVVMADHVLDCRKPQWICACVLNALTAVMALIIAANIYVANQAYLHLHLRYENAASFYTSLVADIKMTPGFDEHTRLAIVGEYRQPDYYSHQFEHLHAITGIYGFVPDSYSKNYFMEYYMGFPIPFASEEEIQQIQSTPEFEAMAVYPYYGSLQKTGDILVVKLS